MKGVGRGFGEGGWCASRATGGEDVSCGEFEVDGVVSGECFGLSCVGLSIRCETAPALCMVDGRPTSVASESVGVAVVGIRRIGSRTGAFAMDESFRGSCGFGALVGLVALRVSFVRTGERGAAEDEVRLLVKEAVGRADIFARSAVMSLKMS